MRRTRTTRLLAISVITTLVTGILALVGIGLGPAQADHGGLTLEVTREVTSADEGGAVTLTARLLPDRSDPTNIGGGVQIDWEFEGGNWDREGGAVTPERPDDSCTIVAPGQNNPNPFPQCSIVIGGPDDDDDAFLSAGDVLVRAWIDHDKTDGYLRGGTEADLAETRLAGDQDCLTEAEPSIIDEQSPDPYEACTSDAGGADEGKDAEFDDTDVVRVIVRRNANPDDVFCPDTTLAPLDGSGFVTCAVVEDGLPAPAGVVVDAKHISGANDPESGSTAIDYTGRTNSNGLVTFEIPAVEGDSDFALICAWVDDDASLDGTGVPIIGTDPSFGSKVGDGGLCPSPGDSSPTEDSSQADKTDAFYVNWQERQLARLDVTPETDQKTVGSQHTVTARVFDQFGDPVSSSATLVKFELLNGSPSDTDSSTLGSPDKTCTTPGNGTETANSCSVTFTSANPGTDTVCSWIEVDDPNFSVNDSCNGETQAGDRSAAIDVVTVRWASATPPPGTPTTDQGYTLVGGDGGVFNYGIAEFHGSTGDMKLNQPIISVAYMPGGTGYWLVAKDGGVFTFGAAKFYGSMGDKKLNAPVLGIESTPTGKGYWLFAADGGIFTFGDAEFHGSTGDMKLNAPMVGMATTQGGDGYWLVASDGGVFTFNAPFYGSTGDKRLNEPVFDMGSAPGNTGYWLVARDGGIFTFGDVDFYGSAANVPGRSTVIGLGVTPAGQGYWIADVNGKVMPFGDAKFFGDRSTSPKNAPMVGFAAVPKG